MFGDALLTELRLCAKLNIVKKLVVSMLLTRLDYGSGTLAGTPGHLMDRLQSVRNTAARLVHVFSKEVRPYNAATQ